MPAMSRTTEMLVSFVLAISVLGAGAAGVVPGGPALGVGAAFAALGALALVRETVAERARRQAADELIETLPSVPGKLRWRARELTSDRERRRLAGSLRSLLETVESPRASWLSPVPLNRLAIQRQRRAVEEIAAALADTRRPVSARAIVLVRRLLLDGVASPLYNPEHVDELAPCLARVRSLLPRLGERR